MTPPSAILKAQPSTRAELATQLDDASDGDPPDPGAAVSATEDSAARLIVDVIYDDGDWSSLPAVEAAIQAAVVAVSERQDLGLGWSEASVALSSDAVVAGLNGTYRGKPKPTNVLSFPAPALPRGVKGAGISSVDDRAHLGDIILAVETILAEAQTQGVPPLHHVQHLAVHGLLHLLGFDHETDIDAERMEALETEILTGLDIPDPYAETFDEEI
jgi:probable rRNA maturation factor